MAHAEEDVLSSLFVRTRLKRLRENERTIDQKKRGICIREDGSYLPLSVALNGYSVSSLDSKRGVPFGKKPIVRIEWPGYPPKSYQLRGKSGRDPPERLPLPVLAQAVAKTMKRFIDKAQGEKISAEKKDWEIGENGIRFEDLHLMILRKVREGGFEARVLYKPVRPL